MLESFIRYWYDPVGFARDCIEWPDDQGLTDYQEHILRLLVRTKLVCVRSGHGSGKTMVDAIAILWFALTRDMAFVDWDCYIFASFARQIDQYLWPEVHKWAKRIKWDVVGRNPFTDDELTKFSLTLTYGVAGESKFPRPIAAHPGQEVLGILTELTGGGIPQQFYSVPDGEYCLAQGTPQSRKGPFYEVHHLHTWPWSTVHVSVHEAIRAQRISAQWVEARKRDWGEESALYQWRVLGEFTDESVPEIQTHRRFTQLDPADFLISLHTHCLHCGAAVKIRPIDRHGYQPGMKLDEPHDCPNVT